MNDTLLNALRECYSALKGADDVFQDFQKEGFPLSADGLVPLQEARRINLLAMKKAEQAIDQADLLNTNSKQSLKIKCFVSVGRLQQSAQEIHTIVELDYAVGRLMDKSHYSEILGDIMFEGEDGRTYMVQLIAHTEEAGPDDIKEVLDNQTEKAKDEQENPPAGDGGSS